MSERIRLLFVVGNFVAGGAERHLLELWRRLDRTRFDVRIACFRREGQFLGAVELLGWPVIDLGIGRRLYGPSGLRGFARLVHLVNEFHPHVVHGYLFGPNLFAALAGRLTGVPVVAVAKRNVDAFETSRQIAVQRLAHGLATHVTAVSDAVAETVVGLGVPRTRITVIPNGVDAARFDTPAADRASFSLPPGVPVIGSVGCLAPRKDYGTLLAALALLERTGRSFHAVLVGDGPERERLEHQAETLGLRGRVTFLGEREDIERLLGAFDLFVLPSREEGIPNALLEAMAVGLPAVATSVGGTPEVLTDGETGWLVPPGNPGRLAAAIGEVLGGRDEARRRGSAAREVVRSRMSIEAMVRRHERFYVEAVAAQAPRAAAPILDVPARPVRSIAYITTTFPTLAAFIENEVLGLTERGVRVRVLTLRPPSRAYQPAYEPLVALTRPVGSVFDPQAWFDLGCWFTRRPAVLIPEMARILWASRSSLYALAGHIGYLPAAARVASIVEAEDLDRVHGVWAHFPATVAYLAARLTGRRFSMAAHAGSDLYRTQAFLAEKARAADFVAACVRQNAEMLSDLAGPDANVEWIYHGVDLRQFDGSGRSRDAEPLLLIVGRLAATKGFEDAILALSQLEHRQARLSVIGDGPLRKALEDLARARGVAERVTFHGAIAHEALLPLYRRAWLLVAPSRVLANGRRDGIPNVIVEAMAMGVPCVGTRVAGIEEAIVPGLTGGLCAANDPAGLAREIDGLLASPAELDRMGAAARQRVREEFDFDRNFERMHALLLGDEIRVVERAVGA